MRSALEIAMERADKVKVPKAFTAQVQQQERVRMPEAEGHLDQQGKCHCGYDQTCTTLVCEACGKKAPHGVVFYTKIDKEATDAWEGEPWKKFYFEVGYKACSCGAKQWVYGCEAFAVRRVN